MEKFGVEYCVGYRLLNRGMTASFPSLMDYVQETSMLHAKKSGYPIEWFLENGKGWVITHWDVRFYNTPKWSDIITINTWPISFKGFVAERGFKAYTSGGECILTANSSWFLTDMQTRKPLRIDSVMAERYGGAFPHPHEKNYHMPDIEREIKEGKLILSGEMEMIVGRRDIDTNDHVNNVRYLEWAYGLVPEECLEDLTISALKVAYKKECRFKDRIKLEMYRDTDNAILIRVKNAVDNAVVHAEIYTKWQ